MSLKHPRQITTGTMSSPAPQGYVIVETVSIVLSPSHCLSHLNKRPCFLPNALTLLTIPYPYPLAIRIKRHCLIPNALAIKLN